MECPTALIVSQEWGDELYGGMPAAVRHLSRALKSIGMQVCSTVFHVNESMQAEARKMGVRLIYPDPPERLRRQPMGAQWLVAHKWYFPELSQLKNIAMVIGFGMMTSDAAVKIQSDLYPYAHYHHINLYSHQTPPVSIGYKKTEFQYCSNAVTMESNKASAVFSLGFQTFHDYCKFYQQSAKHIKHFQILPIPDEKFFSHRGPPSLPDRHEFNILSLLDNSDIQNLCSVSSVLPNALNWVADNIDRSLQQMVKWNIIGVPVPQEDIILKNVKPHSALTVTFQRCHSTSAETELYKSAVVLIPPSSVNNLSLTLSALVCGKPVIIPTESDSHHFVHQFLPSFESKIVVEMRRSPLHLQQKLEHVILNYHQYLEMAEAIKNEMQTNVTQALQNFNKDFLECADESADCLGIQRTPITSTETKSRVETMTVIEGEMTAHKVAETMAEQTAETVVGHQDDMSVTAEGDTTDYQEEMMTDVIENTGEVDGLMSNSEGLARVLENRMPFQISVIQRVSSGVPDREKSVSDIAKQFLSLEDLKEDFSKIFRQFTSIHPDISAECVESNDRYILSCKSLQSAEALWQTYTAGRLDDIINNALISRKRLQKIQARFLALECIIEHEEYSVLQEELREYEANLASQNATEQVDETRSVNQLNDEIGLVEEKLKQMTVQVTHLSKAVHENVDVRDALHADLVGSGNTCQQQIDEMRRVCADLEVRLQRNRDAGNLTELMQAVKDKIRDLDAVQKLLREKKRTKEISQLLSSFSRLDQGIPVRDTVRLFGRQGSLPGSYNDPCGITIKDNGDLVVADSGNQRVQTLDANNKCKSIIKFYGFRRKFKPQDVAVINDTYYIADRSNRHVIVCDQKSRVQALLGVRQLLSPTGLCVSRDGYVYVTDYLANRVNKYDSGTHQLVATTQEGCVIKPHSVILTRKNVLLVSGHNCIYVLDTYLQVLSTFGEGHLERPMGLSTDELNNTYVCSQGKLFFFDSSNQFICSVNHSLTTSNFVTVDDMGRVVCTDSGGNCIKILYT